MDIYNPNNFIFSQKYRVWRHVIFWILHAQIFYFLFQIQAPNSEVGTLSSAMWIPIRILYCYPLMYWVLPQFLLKGKYTQFGIIILLWFISGYFLNYLFRAHVLIPVREALHFESTNKNPWQEGSFLVLTTTAGITSMIVLFKYWFRKQQEWMQAEKEKVTAELQLLKAQVHPHFLFNTLNNIYSFSLENSPKTPGLILKLSSMLSYMLYDCKGEKVLLEKELEVIKNYIGLEKERYGNKIEISLNIEGDVIDKYITPLLLLPFLENAFKHGTSEQLEKPWLSMDVAVKQYTMRCKIVNSKNEAVQVSENGIGIQNVKKRLAFLYPDKHELKIADEGNFFVVSLVIDFINDKINYPTSSVISLSVAKKAAP